jgi:hypothetical protein
VETSLRPFLGRFKLLRAETPKVAVAALDNMHNRVSAMPWPFERKPQYRSYKFIVTGFTFHMFVGMMIAKPIRRICSARRGFLYMSEQRDLDLLKTMAIMAHRAETRGRLAEPEPV